MDKYLLQVMAKRLNLTKPYDEPEEFILKSDEVYDVINHEVR